MPFESQSHKKNYADEVTSAAAFDDAYAISMHSKQLIEIDNNAKPPFHFQLPDARLAVKVSPPFLPFYVY